MRKLSEVLEVAKEILLENSNGLHVREIAEAAVRKNKTLGMDEEAFMKKLTSALSSNVANNSTSIFTKPKNKQGKFKKGIYKLKINAKTPVVKITKSENLTEDNLFTGKAGEYAVASEFLFRGYNVSLMAVDRGIDLVVEREGKYQHVQVKTTTPAKSDGAFRFSIKQISFDKFKMVAPFYVFVMRDGNATNYAIFPYAKLEELRVSKKITGADLSIKISRDSKGKQYFLNNSNDINWFINKFDII